MERPESVRALTRMCPPHSQANQLQMAPGTEQLGDNKSLEPRPLSATQWASPNRITFPFLLKRNKFTELAGWLSVYLKIP